MKTVEKEPQFQEMPEFGMGLNLLEFDINSAFQEAIHGVANDDELALDEKVKRMEVIVAEGSSEVYREFIDFRQMAAEMEMMCNHDHFLNESVQNSDTLNSFLDTYNNDRPDHGNDSHRKDDDDEYEIDPKTGKKVKKKKRRKGWFNLSLLKLSNRR